MNLAYCVIAVGSTFAVMFVIFKAFGGTGRRGKGRYK